MVYAATSHNSIVIASAARAFSLLWYFALPQFCVCEKLLAQFPYRKHKNVSYSRNVICNAD